MVMCKSSHRDSMILLAGGVCVGKDNIIGIIIIIQYNYIM